jgi:HAD superfamily hydrolase (TIGR01490 family)
MTKTEPRGVKESEVAKERSGSVAAFFDLDGTLTPKPSLEKRFLQVLRYRKRIGIENYLAWLKEAVRLLPRGINQIIYGNKMYLRSVSIDEQSSLMVPPFHAKAVERMGWHAERGERIVIVTGTLEPPALRVARLLEAKLAERGLAVEIQIYATRLEVKEGRWTGRITGEAMFGEAKARAVRRLAAECGLELEKCFAYGDSVHDRRMLAAVGRPAAVNPSDDLARIAKRNDWTILRWDEERTFAQRALSAQRGKRKKAEAGRQEDPEEIEEEIGAMELRTGSKA